jgi:hypothetical protein
MTTQPQNFSSYVLVSYGSCRCFIFRLGTLALRDALNLSTFDCIEGVSGCSAGGVGCLNKRSQFVRVAESKWFPPR